MTPTHPTRKRPANNWRKILALTVATIVLTLLAVFTPTVAANAQSDNSGGTSQEVRIRARKLSNGKVEFALRVGGGDKTGSTVLYPRTRHFPANAAVGRWLVSSTLNLDVGQVRIAARKLSDGRIEFAVEQKTNNGWGPKRLPANRTLAYAGVAAGRWLQSSPITLKGVGGSAASSEVTRRANPPWGGKGLFAHLHTTTNCAPLPAHAPQDWCLKPADSNTIRLFACKPYGETNPDYITGQGMVNFVTNDPGIGTRWLPLRVGTRVEHHSTCTWKRDTLQVILGFDGWDEVHPAGGGGEIPRTHNM